MVVAEAKDLHRAGAVSVELGWASEVEKHYGSMAARAAQGRGSGGEAQEQGSGC